MQPENHASNNLYPHVSVDCVLIGIYEDRLCVLLAEKTHAGTGKTEYKLPGSLIYQNEDLDKAAARILNDTTGIKRLRLKQFRAFGSPERTSDKDDILWLENASRLKIGRIITIAYLALCKVQRPTLGEKYNNAQWTPVDNLPRLPFDHPQIITEAIKEIRIWINTEPSIVFQHLPQKFTALHLRRTYEILYGKTIDPSNFHKKMNTLEYIIPTEETQKGVSHRSARYYRFDRAKYTKTHTGLK